MALLGTLQEAAGKAVPRRTDTSDLPFIPMALLPSHELYVTRWELRPADEIRSGVVVSDGDFLLAKITPCLENGKQAIVKGLPGGWGYATTEVFPIRSNADVHTEFLAYYFKLPQLRSYLAQKMEGATGRQRLPRPVLENLLIPLPPLPEQRAIARILRTLQRAREQTEVVLAATRNLRASLMRHLFTYGPVPIDQADQVPLKESEIGPVPEHWQFSRLDALTSRGGGTIQTGPFGSLLHASDYAPDGVPFVMPKDLSPEGRIVTSGVARIGAHDYQRLARYHLKEGDLLAARRGELGRRGLVEQEESGWVCGTGCLIIRPGRLLHSGFLAHAFGTSWLRDWLAGHAVGTTMANLSAEILARLPLAVPPLDEQAEVARMLSDTDLKLEAEQARKRALDTLFTTLLHELMTARIRVDHLGIPEPAGGA